MHHLVVQNRLAEGLALARVVDGFIHHIHQCGDAPRGAADVERTTRKLSYDMYYLKHRSFPLDMAIALKTVRALLSFSGT